MSNIPKLRFPEFSGEWEEKNFYEVFDILQNNTFSRDQLNNENGIVRNIHYGDVLIKYGDYIDCQKEKLPFINLENNLSKYEDTSYVKNGDIIIADTAEDYTAGKVTEICNVKDYKILSGLHTFLCRTKFEFASKFLGYKLNSGSYHNQIAPLVAGTKVYSINRKAIGETTITYPSKAEQQKIADFLSNVDSIITAETKILNTLQKKKKALMQKLFTRQLRFKSADGTNFPAWEEKCIDEIAECIAGATPDTKKNEYWENGTIPWMSSGEVNKKYVYETDRTITQLGYKKCSTKMIPVNTVVIALAGQGKTRGTVALTKIELCTNQSLCAITNKSEYNSEYLFHYLSSQYQELRKISSGGDASRGGLNLKLVGSYRVPLPCLAEQQKIADCLSSIDSLIQTQQKVVTTWQQRKKALLQQMFV